MSFSISWAESADGHYWAFCAGFRRIRKLAFCDRQNIFTGAASRRCFLPSSSPASTPCLRRSPSIHERVQESAREKHARQIRSLSEIDFSLPRINELQNISCRQCFVSH